MGNKRSDRDQTKTKRVYSKPKLRQIRLNPGEVLGVGCKTTVSQGPMFVPCIAGCSQSGS
ncbi:MAG: hypothetical protein MUP41_12410 [Desulfobacterales bacterium]|nr:hypothetical protein [Desulfobacterales bacterium]